MKAKEIIEKLQALDPEMEVFIQQGEDYDYMKSYTVKIKELFNEEEEAEETAIVIEYY